MVNSENFRTAQPVHKISQVPRVGPRSPLTVFKGSFEDQQMVVFPRSQAMSAMSAIVPVYLIENRRLLFFMQILVTNGPKLPFTEWRGFQAMFPLRPFCAILVSNFLEFDARKDLFARRS
jgi:hypothetical protein